MPLQPVTDFVDATSIPNVSFFWRGEMIEVWLPYPAKQPGLLFSTLLRVSH